MNPRDVLLIDTGVSNLASIEAGLRRAGALPRVSRDPDEVRSAPRAVLPGVGSFAAARERLAHSGIDTALRERVVADRPLLAICLGMQLLCEGSEESPGVPGLGVIPERVEAIEAQVSTPHLGWNRVRPAESDGDAPPCSLLEEGHAYFAHGYRLSSIPAGFAGARTRHGTPFVAALERGSLLACQFHPEISGRYGLELMTRFLEIQA